jgi:hypothetical protein
VQSIVDDRNAKRSLHQFCVKPKRDIRSADENDPGTPCILQQLELESAAGKVVIRVRSDRQKDERDEGSRQYKNLE